MLLNMKKFWIHKSDWSISNSTKILLILTALIAIGYLVYQSNFLFKDKPFITSDLPKYRSEDPNASVTVDFEYTVSQISDEQIVLSGDKGEFILPNDSALVSVYQGSTVDSPTIPLESLTVGATLNLEFIPNQSAKLFIVGEKTNEI